MSDGSDDRARLTARVDGYVQGVGFRFWVREQAIELDLGGTAINLADGRVEVVVEGPEESCRRLLEELRGSRTPGRVTEVHEQWSAPRGDVTGFTAR